MAHQRYHPADQHYPPPDAHRFPQRPRSPLRYADDRSFGSNYAPPNRPRDQNPRFEEPRDRNGPSRNYGPPTGPRASVDAPRGRGPIPSANNRGRPFQSRGDFRGDFRGGNREAYRPPDDVRYPTSSDFWNDRDPIWRDAEPVRRISDVSSVPRDSVADVRDYRDHPPRERDHARDPLPPRDVYEQSYDDPASRWRGRERGRGDLYSRARGRGLFQGERGRQSVRSRSPGPEPRTAWNFPRSRSPLEQRDKRFVDRRESLRQGDTQGPPQVFDPYTQDRAAAREQTRAPRPQSPPAAASRPHLGVGSSGAPQNHNQAHSGSRQVQSQQAQVRELDRAEHGASSQLDNVRSALPTPRAPSLRGAASPPRAPQVPAFGSIPSAPKSALAEPRIARPPLGAPMVPTGPRSVNAPPPTPRAEPDRQPPTAPRAVRERAASVLSDGKFNETNLGRDQPLVRQVSPSEPPTRDGRSLNAWSRVPQGNIPVSNLPAPPPPPPPPPPSLPSGPRANTSSASVSKLLSHVPTGPKADRGPQHAATNGSMGLLASSAWPRQWPQVSLPPEKPGSVVPVKRDARGTEIARDTFPSEQSKLGRNTTGTDLNPSQTKGLHKDPLTAVQTTEDIPKSPAWGEEPPDFGSNASPGHRAHAHVERPNSVLSKTAKTVTDASEDLMDLDEADYQEKEDLFQRQKARYEAEKVDLEQRYLRGATPLEQLALLSSLSLLILPQPDEPPALSPGGDDDSDARAQPSTPSAIGTDEIDVTDKYLTSAFPSPITDAELDALPFLSRPISKSGIDRDTFDFDLRGHDMVRFTIAHRLKAINHNRDGEEATVRKRFEELYESWMDMVEQLDEIVRDESPEPDEAPPALPLLDAPPMQLSAGGRRGMVALGSEFDLERVIQESLHTATQEEAKRKKQESSAKFDDDKEVSVPDLLSDLDRAKPRLLDTRHLLHNQDLRVVYCLEPEPDDFVQEEHERLISGFSQWPKKWGRIACYVGNDRTYKDCIKHYYSSKWAGEFKDRRDKRRARISKGGKLRTSQRPKANALMSNLGDARTDVYEGDEFLLSSTAITESGRPRRAAAPSFGNKEPAVEEQNGTTQVPLRKAAKPGLPNDNALDKPARRSRGLTKDRAQRKPKSTPVLRGTSASPEKNDFEQQGSELAPNLIQHGFEPAYTPGPSSEGWRSVLHDGAHYTYNPMQGAGIFVRDGDMDDPRLSLQARRSNMSSYWSVNEINNFWDLVRELGSDWSAISQRLGTKTAQMAKNYYKRAVEKGHKPGIEDDLRSADDRRAQANTHAVRAINQAMNSPLKQEHLVAKPSSQRTLAPSIENIASPLVPTFHEAVGLAGRMRQGDDPHLLASSRMSRPYYSPREQDAHLEHSVPGTRSSAQDVLPAITYDRFATPGPLRSPLTSHRPRSPPRHEPVDRPWVTSGNMSRTGLSSEHLGAGMPSRFVSSLQDHFTPFDKHQSMYWQENRSEHAVTYLDRPGSGAAQASAQAREEHSRTRPERLRDAFDDRHPIQRADSPDRRGPSPPYTQALPPPPPPPPREPRKQSNLVDLLNAEPEVSQPRAEQQRPEGSNLPQYMSARQDAPRFAHSQGQNYADNANPGQTRYTDGSRSQGGLGSGDPHDRSSVPSSTTPDWVARIGQYPRGPSFLARDADRLGPFDYRRRDILAADETRVPSPPPGIHRSRIQQQQALSQSSSWDPPSNVFKYKSLDGPATSANSHYPPGDDQRSHFMERSSRLHSSADTSNERRLSPIRDEAMDRFNGGSRAGRELGWADGIARDGRPDRQRRDESQHQQVAGYEYRHDSTRPGEGANPFMHTDRPAPNNRTFDDPQRPASAAANSQQHAAAEPGPRLFGRLGQPHHILEEPYGRRHS